MRVLLVLLAFLTCSCYEGWEYDNQGDGTVNPEPEPPPAEKPLFYILFEPFTLAPEAIENSLCFPNTGNKQFRTNEWSSRIGQAAAALATVSEHVVTVQRNVGAGDCQRLDTVANASIDPQPWGSQQRPVQDPKGRRYVHLKAVFWDGDPPARLQANVRKSDWLAWTSLKAGGLPTRSLHYFVFSGAANGYFSNWRAAEPADQVMNGEAIERVNPTPEGIKARDATISRDAAALAGWVKSQQ